MKTNEQIIKKTESESKAHGFNWKCIEPKAGKTPSGHNTVIMKCLDTGQISKPALESNITKGKDIFRFFERTDDIIAQKINEIGIKSNPSFICSNPRAGKNKSYSNLVEVQCIETKEKKITEESAIIKNKNPFNKTQNRVELKETQPLYEELLKKYKLKYIKEYNIGTKRIDFVFFLGDKKIGLEVKQSDKRHYSSKGQIETYKRLSKELNHNLHDIILSDPKGKHPNSISIKKLEEFIKNGK